MWVLFVEAAKKKIKRSDLNVPGRRVAFSQFANVQDRT